MNHSTPIRRGWESGERSKRERWTNEGISPLSTRAMKIPRYQYITALNLLRSIAILLFPQTQRFFLFRERKRGWQRRGRGYPPRRGRPPTHPQLTRFSREQWKGQPYWERDNVQQQGPRREEQGDVGLDAGGQIKKGDGLGGIYNFLIYVTDS